MLTILSRRDKMEKINIGSGVVNYPMPVALVGSIVNGKPNFLTVAWISMVSYAPPKIAVTLGNHHYTNPGIKKNNSFSLCFPSQPQLTEVDYCGLVSGADIDKSKLFDIFYGELQTAPMIEQFAMNVECQLDKVIENGKNETFIGDIKGIYCDKSILENGKVSLEKLNPILLSQTEIEYRGIGTKIGDAWKAGKEHK